jgi:D-3-phosphoglycerate dehydrogenase
VSNTKILIAEPLDFSPAAASLLRSVGDVQMGLNGNMILADAFREFDIVWLRLAQRITAEVLGTQPRCRVLATPVTGLDHIDLPACQMRGVTVVSLKGEVEFLRNVRATAELTVALALALLRKIPQAAGAVRAGQWNRDLFRGHELFGKTAGIVGVGRLGTLVAGYLRAFGMTVLGYDIREDYPSNVAERVPTLEELFERSDLLSVHVAYNDSTRHLIAERHFNRLRGGAVLVNTARGGVVDETALLTALQSGQLGGAALDVLDGEPAIDASHPLVRYAADQDNLLIVPHLGGNTVESFAKTELFLAERVVAALR